MVRVVFRVVVVHFADFGVVGFILGWLWCVSQCFGRCGLRSWAVAGLCGGGRIKGIDYTEIANSNKGNQVGWRDSGPR